MVARNLLLLGSDFDVMQILLEDDLVDTCTPGDRIVAVGVFKTIPPRPPLGSQIGGMWPCVVVANSVRLLSWDADTDLTLDDFRYCCVVLKWHVLHNWHRVEATLGLPMCTGHVGAQASADSICSYPYSVAVACYVTTEKQHWHPPLRRHIGVQLLLMCMDN